jgi:hypothetical protein
VRLGACKYSSNRQPYAARSLHSACTACKDATCKDATCKHAACHGGHAQRATHAMYAARADATLAHTPQWAPDQPRLHVRTGYYSTTHEYGY